MHPATSSKAGVLWCSWPFQTPSGQQKGGGESTAQTHHNNERKSGEGTRERQQLQQQQNVKGNKFWNKRKIGQSLSLLESATMLVTSERSFIWIAPGTVLFGSGLFLQSDFNSVLFSKPSKDIPLGAFSEIAAVGLKSRTATVCLASKWMGLHMSRSLRCVMLVQVHWCFMAPGSLVHGMKSLQNEVFSVHFQGPLLPPMMVCSQWLVDYLAVNIL